MQVLLVWQPDFRMHMHRTRIHRLKHDRVGAVLKFDFKAKVLFDGHFQNVRSRIDGRPVRNTDHNIGGHDRTGKQHCRPSGNCGEFSHFSLLDDSRDDCSPLLLFSLDVALASTFFLACATRGIDVSTEAAAQPNQAMVKALRRSAKFVSRAPQGTHVTFSHACVS